jgi:hydrogenase maturation protease
MTEGSRPRRRALVIGYGSPIRGDDAVGPLVADRLLEKGVPEGVSVIARHILTAELVPDIAASELVVFLDAAADGEPGEVRCRPISPSRDGVSTMAHFLDPRELLAWCQALYDRLPRAWLITVSGESFDYASYELTATADSSARSMLRKVQELIAEPD